MAISATFSADFSSFNAAIERADVKLRGLDSSSRFVERSLNRMTDNFSGRKLIQEATLMVDAIDRIGGTSKLTETELQSVGAKAAEAAEKMKRLGIDVPPKLDALAASAQKPATAFQSLIGTLGKLNPLMAAFGASLSIGAVVGFAKEIGNFAGQMLDLSVQTGLSTTRLQAFNLVGAGAGLTIEDIATSADQLSKRLGDGDKSVVSALEKMGLSVDVLKNKDLDAVMFDIDKALVGVNNQFERASILNDLFGRSGARMGRILTGSLEDVTKAAEETGAIIDEQLLKKADEFDDAWAQGWIKFRAYAVEAVDYVGGLLSKLGDAATEVGRAMREDANSNQFGLGQTGGPNITYRTGPLRTPRHIVPGSIASDIIQGSGIPEVEKLQKLNVARKEEIKLLEQSQEGISFWLARYSNLRTVTQSGPGLLGNLPSSNINPALAMFGPLGIGGGGSGGGSTSGGGGFLGGLTGGFGKLLGGFTGGGGAGGFLGKLGGSLVGGIGNLLGGALTGGISSLLGAAVGGLGKLFSGLFGGEGKATNRARDSAISDFTGISGDKGASQAKFRELATAAGVASSELDKLFSTKKQKEFEAGLDSITKKMDAFASEQEADSARLTAAIEKYGISFEQAGAAFQKQELDKQAKELIEDWRVLVGSGIDVGLVNEKMSESINDYLQTAIRVGQEVPNALRPIISKMLEQGLLTDEAGNAITDLEQSGIKFSETMTEGFDKVVKKLDELITKLGLAGDALAGLPVTNIDLPAYETDPRFQTAIPMAGGGRGRVSSPTLFLAGVGGPEDFAFSGENRRFGGGGSSAELRGIRNDLSWLRSTLPLALRDAVLLAR